METTRRDAANVLDFRPPEPVSSSEIEDALRELNEISPAPSAALHRRASINLRRHVVRSAIRVSVLLSLDLVTYVAARGVVRLLRQDATFAWIRGVVRQLFVEGFLGGAQFACALVVGLLVMGCYGPGDRRRDARRLFLACSLAAALSLWSELWSGSPVVALGRFAMTSVLFGSVLLSARLLMDAFVGRYYLRPVLARTLIVGPAEDCHAVLRRGAFRERTGFNVIGFIDTALPQSPTARGQLSQLDAILHDDRIDTVVLCGQITERRFTRVVRAATAAECHVLSLTRSFALAGMQPAVQWHRGVPLVELRAPVLRGQQMFLKRAMDICVSAAALAMLSPLIAVIAALIRIETPGSVFFAQRRLGRHGRVFHCFKFRSMHIDAEDRLREDAQLYDLYLANDYKLPEPLDTRVTRLGRLLRRTSLDEIPQLFNVLRGDMSLVGPRPIVPDEIKHYYHEGPLFLSLKPGLTGAWQVNGRSGVSYPERARLELEYVQSWSWARDMEILLRTIPAVLFQHGAH